MGASEIIFKLRKGETVQCENCKKGTYKTTASDISISHEFKCDNCGEVVRISPAIIVE